VHHDVFFEDDDIQHAIQRVSEWPNIVIYLGAGATVDRTGLAWITLIDELLQPLVGLQSLRSALLGMYTPVQAASVVHDLYEERYGVDNDPADRGSTTTPAERAIVRRLQDLLYGPRECMNGRLLESACSLAVAFHRAGRKACLVTPNYDHFLLETLTSMTADDANVSILPVLADDPNRSNIDTILEDGEFPCVYLHGLVPSSGNAPSQPVISERQYHDRAENSATILQELMKDRNVLIVGSSLTDAPLLEALQDTKPAKKEATSDVADSGPERPGTERIAFLPLQGREWRAIDHDSTRDHVQGLVQKRLHLFDVNPIYPHFFFQVGQFIDEVRTCLRHAQENVKYTDYVCPYRYGARLESWWDRWLGVTQASPDAQREHHDLLRETIPVIAELVAAPPSEMLKVEVWLRWRPESERLLCLWASSVGNWPEVRSMRQDNIGVDSQYRSVRIFCAGAPMFLPADIASGEESRWKTYFGLPIWLEADGAVAPVGVVTLASMLDETRSSVTPRNLRRIKYAIPVMEKVGRCIALLDYDLTKTDPPQGAPTTLTP
jgi:hypothetical protein